MTGINNLPNEILEIIFKSLPLKKVKDIVNYQLVCKRWVNLARYVFKNTFALKQALQKRNLYWEKWQSKNTVSPPARHLHMTTFHKNTMFVFGGSALTLLNDLWAFDMSTRQWRQCFSPESHPSPRPKAWATIVCHEDCLIVFGGSFQGILFKDLHVYNLERNHWMHHEISSPWPPAMADHTATIHGRKMIIFGGNTQKDTSKFRHSFLQPSNDVWTLNLDTFTWQLQETSVNKPSPCIWHYQFHIDDENLLIVGMGAQDMWLLTMTPPVWTWREIRVEAENKFHFRPECKYPACKFGEKLIFVGEHPDRNVDQGIMENYMSAIFICDLSHVFDAVDPYAKWLEPRKECVFPGAPFYSENSSLVVCKNTGQMLFFGGFGAQKPNTDEYLANNNLYFIRPFQNL
ncbi:uncharacterized protein DMENIID0001_064440 [Sergentomyia squamirostris]